MTQRHGLSVPCDALLDEFEQQSLAPRGSVVYTARLKLITPALLGGFDPRTPDALTPIRDKALRGQLRGWWRMLALAGDFDGLNLPGTPLKGDAAKVRDREFALWGALGDGEASQPSAIGLSVAGPPWLEQDGEVYSPNSEPFKGLGLALHFADRSRTNPNEHARWVCTKPLLFDLIVTVRELSELIGYASTVELTIQCWSLIGGIGGRNSRGIGAVTLEKFTCDGINVAPMPAALGALSTASRGTMRVLDLQCVRGLFVATADGINTPFSSGNDALTWGLEWLQHFLQLTPLQLLKRTDRNAPPSPLGRGPGRMSNWPEARLVRALTATYFRDADPNKPNHHHDPASRPGHLPGGHTPLLVTPRIAFGHRTIAFRRDQSNVRAPGSPDPQPHALLPAGGDRFPSSLLVRPIELPVEPGQPPRYGCLVLQRTDMATTLANPSLRLVLKQDGRERTEQLRVWHSDWRAKRANGHRGFSGGCDSIRPLEDSRCWTGIFQPPRDAAQAFINLVFNRHQRQAER